jgi:heme-degrading monooxygenase HmoA
MFLRVASFTARPGRLDDVVRFFLETKVPAARRMPGFHHAYCGVDADSNTGKVVGIWESKESASAWDGVSRDLMRQADGLLAGPLIVDGYEIAAQV